MNDYQNIFWGLGEDNWWKQIIDGRVHECGPLVFDNGYGDFPDGIWGSPEPGYLEGVKNASLYAADHLEEPLTQELYQEIHCIACAHFNRVDRCVVNMDFDKRGEYREDHCQVLHKTAKYFYRKEDESLGKIIEKAFFLQYCVKMRLKHQFEINDPSMDKKFFEELSVEIKESLIKDLSEKDSFTSTLDVEDHINNGNPFFHETHATINQINEQMEDDRARYKIHQPFAKASFFPRYNDPFIKIDYLYTDPESIEQVVENIFTYYNEKIANLPANPTHRTEKENNKALKEIARLYQNLEWLHPFCDGQGRTDLVLLSKLLVENGFTPVILYEPYFSTYEPLERWIEYLKEGMQQWQDEKLKNETIPTQEMIDLDP